MGTYTHILRWVFILVSAVVPPLEVEAAIIPQTEITVGSVKLDVGGLGMIDESFTRYGTPVMNKYQPSSQMFAPVLIGHDLTFSLFTKSGGPAFHFPPPSGMTSGPMITVNLTAVFAGLSSSQRGGWMTQNSIGSLPVGGIATGFFDQTTHEFDISWTHALTGIPCLTSWTYSLHGKAHITSVKPAPVPLPGTVFLFGSGIAALMGFVRRNRASAKFS